MTESEKGVVKIASLSRVPTTTSTTGRGDPLPSGQVRLITKGLHPKEPPNKRQAMPVIFAEDDKEVVFSHNNVIVVIFNVKNYDLHRILIDNGSLVNILYFDAFVKLGISLDQLTWMDASLIGFTGDAIPVEGISLTTRMGSYPPVYYPSKLFDHPSLVSLQCHLWMTRSLSLLSGHVHL